MQLKKHGLRFWILMVSPSPLEKLFPAPGGLQGSAPLDWRSLGFDYVPTKSHIRWGDPVDSWVFLRKLKKHDSHPGSNSVQCSFNYLDTVWACLGSLWFYSIVSNVIFTYCRMFEHGVRMESDVLVTSMNRIESPLCQGFVALACALRMGTSRTTLFGWSKKKNWCFRDPALTLKHLWYMMMYVYILWLGLERRMCKRVCFGIFRGVLLQKLCPNQQYQMWKLLFLVAGSRACSSIKSTFGMQCHTSTNMS